MSGGVRKHKVKEGEANYTLLSISHYGDELGVAAIKEANTGVADPPPVGVTLIIPERDVATPEPPMATKGVRPDECELWVNRTRFRFWETMNITETLDAVSTLDFTAPQADTEAFREAFHPLSFSDLHLFVGGNLVFTGTMLRPQLKTNAADGPVISVGGYARSGVLGDCTMPAGSFPFQLKGVALPVIAKRCAAPFSLGVEVVGDMGGDFRRVRLKSEQKVLAFLIGLAKERKVLLSNDEHGNLLLREPPKVGPPVATLIEGQSPLEGITIQTDPQKFFSHITVGRKKARRVTSSAHTVINPGLQGVLRPIIVRSEDTNSAAELPTAAEALAGRMLAGAVAWQADVATWLVQNQRDLWGRGDTVSVLAPSAGILRRTDLIIREIRFSKDPTKSTAALELALPGAFSGELPDRFPWQA